MKVTAKVILITMIIPIILIFTMTTTINMSSIMVDIPVSDIEIQGDEVYFVNVRDKDNTVKLNTVVTPKEASDKSITYKASPIGSDRQADVEISQDGIVTPRSTGSVKITATSIGGRQDSVQINFYSSLVEEIKQVNKNFNIKVGEEMVLLPGEDFLLLPQGSGGKITYYSDSNKISVDKYTGKVMGLFEGESKVIAKVEGITFDENKRVFVDTIYEIDFDIYVSKDNNQNEVFSFAGGENNREEIVYLNTISIPFEYNGLEKLGYLKYELDEEDKEYVESVSFKYYSNNMGDINVTLKKEAINKNYIFTINAGGVSIGKLTLNKKIPEIEIASLKDTYAISNENIVFGSNVKGLDGGYTIKCESSNPDVLFVNTRNNECVGIAKSVGSAYVSAKLYIDGEMINVSNLREFKVIDPYISIAIIENAKTYGLENRFVYGKYRFQGGVVKTDNLFLSLKVSNYKGNVENIEYTKLLWSVSDDSIAVVDETGNIKVLKDGIVKITVESKYNIIHQYHLITIFVSKN